MTSVGGLCDVLSEGNVDISYSKNITDIFVRTYVTSSSKIPVKIHYT